MEIGKKLRLLRGSMAQSELSRRSGIDKAIISKIESGKMTGTVETHKKIAGVFGLKLSELYAYIEQTHSDLAEFHAGNGRTDTYGEFLEILSSIPLSKKMLPVLLTLRMADERHLEDTVRDVERFILILDGEVEIEVDGKVYSLKKEAGREKGDCLYSRSPKRHRIKNIGQAAARLLCVSSPPVL